jgi:hypothetical protein
MGSYGLNRELKQDKCRRVVKNVHLKQRKVLEEEVRGHLRKECFEQSQKCNEQCKIRVRDEKCSKEEKEKIR